MKVAYDKLWELLHKNNLRKKDLLELTGISSRTMAKLEHCENVTTDILVKICEVLHCKSNEIFDIIPDDIGISVASPCNSNGLANCWDKKRVKPFLKWAGGKGQLLTEIEKYYPFDGIKFTKYAEPFVGGGAVLFDILSKYNLEEVYIGDINAELINTYRIIRDKIDELVTMLMHMQKEFIPMDTEHRKVCYMVKRERFNDLKVNGNESVNIEKAALMIFLNKTCFNGLFRVNQKGLFNVPMGAYKNPMICDEENLRAVSEKLQNVKIACGDYRESADFIDKNTFVYFDPPYRPITDTASFTAYTENLFNDEEQIELAKFVDEMHGKGAKIVISNLYPKKPKVRLEE